MPVIQMYADLTCPFAYVVHSTWRVLREEFEVQFGIEHKSLALEYVNSRPTPKAAIESEIPYLFPGEAGIAWQAWSAPVSSWPVTVWPAFEAVKCAERQGLARADDLAWAIRTAFFGESRCISMRHELLALAEQCGLAMDEFIADFDAGRGKPAVIAEARKGWEELRVPGSPTWVMPNGTVISDFGLVEIQFDEQGEPTGSVPGMQPAERAESLRAILAEGFTS